MTPEPHFQASLRGPGQENPYMDTILEQVTDPGPLGHPTALFYLLWCDGNPWSPLSLSSSLQFCGVSLPPHGSLFVLPDFVRREEASQREEQGTCLAALPAWQGQLAAATPLLCAPNFCCFRKGLKTQILNIGTSPILLPS